jgi:hypothetical protein
MSVETLKEEHFSGSQSGLTKPVGTRPETWESGELARTGSGWFGTARVQKFEFELKN